MLIVILVLSVISYTGFSQSVPELIFKNPTRTGTAGANGTIYKFASVATGIDALVKINSRSDNSVALSNIDITNSGFDNAFQPEVSYCNGDVPKNVSWWMEFSISFVKSSDNTIPQTVTAFDLTALDVDGDDSKLKEQLNIYGLNSYTCENNTSLSVSNIVGGKTFTAPTTNYNGINTGATRVMVTCQYINTYSFNIRVGGTNGSSTSRAGERLNSFWFKSFTYSNPTNLVLPVKIVSFTAQQENKGTTLNWETSNETNFSHFVIQRSAEGGSYSDAAVVFTNTASEATTKKYAYTDTKEATAIVYYRLKMVDIDGKFEYSAVKVIRSTVAAKDDASITIFPNPAVSDIKVTIPASWQNKVVAYSVYNGNGVQLSNKVSTRAMQTELIYVSGLKPGLYILKVSSGDATFIKQFVK